MLVINPYETSYGKTIYKDKIKQEFVKYLITTDVNDLSYGLNLGSDTKYVFITGRNKDEQELPPLVYPLITQDIKNKTNIVVDLRKFCKDTKEITETSALKDILKDKPNGEFYINTALIMSDFLEEDMSAYRKVFPNITGGYSAIVASIVNACVPLSVLERAYIEVGSNYWANLLLCTSRDYVDYQGAIASRIANSRLSIPVDLKFVKQVINEIRLPEKLDIYGLVDICKQLISEDKRTLIDSKVYISLIANMWFGVNSLDLLAASQESIPLWISIMYSSLSNLAFSKARVSQILDKNSKMVDTKDFVKHIETHLKEKGGYHV